MKSIAAYIGIAGALSMAVCDVILLGQPVSGSYYDLSSFGAMERVTPLRSLVGSTVGLACSFFICFGFWHLKSLFAPVNPKLSMILFVALCSSAFFGGAFHAAYYFLAAGIHSGQNVNLPPPVIFDFKTHLEIISYLGVPGFLAGSVLFFSMSLNNQFPRWYKYCNPLVICGFVLAVLYVMPAPAGGFLRPAFFNLGLSTCFILSLKIGPK